MDPVNNLLTRAVMRGPARRQVANPVLARYLDELAKADRLASQWDATALAAQARRAGGVAESLPPPRGPLPPADYNAAIESMLPQRGYEVPFADELRSMDRTRALVNNRLDRLTPEQQASSLPFVGRLADWDARMARRQFMESDMDLPTRIGLAGGAAALGTAGYMKMTEDAQIAAEEERQARLLEAEEERQARLLEEALATGEEFGYLAPPRVGLEELIHNPEVLGYDSDPSDPMPMDFNVADLAEGIGTEFDWEEAAAEAGAEGRVGPGALLSDAINQFPDVAARAAGRMEDLFLDEEEQIMLGHDSQQEEAYSPPVVVEQEPLPGPKARSIQALMRAGLPEGRARDIILKGYGMSPDEYRAVTGGRR